MKFNCGIGWIVSVKRVSCNDQSFVKWMAERVSIAKCARRGKSEQDE